ncbi:GNAT family N-acetyltransferase [Flavivirga aquatica]|uniref:GNAT family N-acetyltransferase n=1 Tax=Flavivirga aquatica TaxID=1849968 RepID=A0A1E5TA60_9FLAO|nr:GNAT family N-acetyltransferase [Flavivirga aquatica]OEK08241.1 GNAT family N-acetyltransferase [Flavivirga aquatica]
MIIRDIKEKDLEQIVQLCELHAAYEKAKYSPKNKFELLSQHLFNTSNNVNCLVVELNQNIVGYATYIKQFSTWDASFYIYLDCLFLKEETRGKGIGVLIMQKIKDYAKSENCEIIQWQTPDFNENAISFYKKIGAQSKVKERFFWKV